MLPDFRSFFYMLQVLPIEDLHEHERISPKRFLVVKNKIISDSYFIDPIIADKKTKVVLDGHHRLNVLKLSGFKNIPVFLVDYFSKDIKVKPRRQHIKISKKIVIEKGLSPEVFPYKTTRHILNIDKPKIKIALEDLK
jgi:hypothetical protein